MFLVCTVGQVKLFYAEGKAGRGANLAGKLRLLL